MSSVLTVTTVRSTKTSVLIAVTCTLSISAFVIIVILPNVSFTIWITTILFALANIPTVNLTYVTVERFNYMTPRVAAVFTGSIGFATLITTLIGGFLFSSNPMAIMYLCLIFTLMGSITYVSSMLLNNLWVE